MTAKQGSSKKKRTSKRSSGERRSSARVRLSRLELALMGKGPTARYRPMTRGETDIYLSKAA